MSGFALLIMCLGWASLLVGAICDFIYVDPFTQRHCPVWTGMSVFVVAHCFVFAVIGFLPELRQQFLTDDCDRVWARQSARLALLSYLVWFGLLLLAYAAYLEYSLS
jgi:hypothetical protein